MEEGEVNFSKQEVFSNSDMAMGELLPTNCSMESFFEGLLMDSSQATACTHTHTCNKPTGTESTHTHTCFHVHTKILPEESDEKVVSTDDTAESCGKKRPLGNREAVRKYREKKKAKAASLEDEVMRLRDVNMQLVKRLQCQATLEAEVSRLKCLLVDLRGRIDGEIGAFPYQKPANNPSFSQIMMNPCNVQCDDGAHCLQDGYGGNSKEGGASINEQGLSGCEFDQLQCIANQNLGGYGNGSFNNANASGSNKRNGGHHAPGPV